MPVQSASSSAAPIEPASPRPRPRDRDRPSDPFSLPEQARSTDAASEPLKPKAQATAKTDAPGQQPAPAAPVADEKAGLPKAAAAANDPAPAQEIADTPVAQQPAAPAVLGIEALIAIAVATGPAKAQANTSASDDTKDETKDEPKKDGDTGAVATAADPTPPLQPAPTPPDTNILASMPWQGLAAMAVVPGQPPAAAGTDEDAGTVSATGTATRGQAGAALLGKPIMPWTVQAQATPVEAQTAGATAAAGQPSADPVAGLSVAKIGVPASAKDAATVEFKALDGSQPQGQAIDLSALASQQLASKPVTTAPNDLVSAQTAPATAHTATAPTPLHVVPIEIGMKAMSGMKQFEIRLDPAELGRIDVSLDISDKGEVSARLVVDRVETLHLLQRDARTLERAFEQAGLKPSDAGVDITLRNPSDPSSAFRQQRQQDDAPRSGRQAKDEADDDVAISTQDMPLRRMVRLGGVDLSI